MNNLKIRLHRWRTGHELTYISKAVKTCSCGKQWVR